MASPQVKCAKTKKALETNTVTRPAEQASQTNDPWLMILWGEFVNNMDTYKIYMEILTNIDGL